MQRLGHRRLDDRVGHGRLGQARDRDDVARAGFFDRHALEAAERHDLGGAAFLDDIAFVIERLDRHVELELARGDAAGQHAADEIVAVEQGGEHLERAVGIGVRLADIVDDRLEQRIERAFADVVGQAGIAVAAAGVERREIELLVIGFEAEEQLEHFVQHFGGARVGTVDLVDDDDRLEAERERLAGDELGLRHRAFGGVDEQDHAIDHRQDALDLGAEIGVAGRVDDVDVRSLPLDRGALRENGDAALFFEVVRIHRALFDALVVAEGAGLAEKLVDERGLAMIDVRNDRHVAKAHIIIPMEEM